MSSSQGLIVTDIGGNIRDERKLQYDSRKKKLIVDPRTDPVHLRVFERDGGTRITLDPGESYQETLLTIPHRMPYEPMFLSYYYCIDTPDDGSFSGIGDKYGINQIQMVYNCISCGDDTLQSEIDDTNFRIERYVNGPYSGDDPYTFKADEYLFRIRYMIIAQENYRNI